MAKQRYFKRKHKRALLEILVAAGLLGVIAGLSLGGVLRGMAGERWLTLGLYLLPYAVVGWRVVWRSVRNLTHGQVFDESFLMTLATIGAFGVGEYPEAVFVMLFYRVGELFEEIAVGQSRASIAALMEIRPEVAYVERAGVTVSLSPDDVAVGEILVISPGQRVPLDGVIIEGSTTLDTAALTGESLPRSAEPGDTIASGCVNLTGLVRVRVTRPYGQSTVAKLLELVAEAGEHKSRSENFITRFARYYTPAVVAAAVLLAVLPPLLLGMGDGDIWRTWIHRALSFLVISCPCALVISVPLAFFGGIGGASRQGILVKGSAYLETLAACDTLVFDKTGTLTLGRFSVVEVAPVASLPRETLLAYAALCESHSTHPIARALVAAVPTGDSAGDTYTVTDLHEQAGLGITAHITSTTGERHRVAVGNLRLMEAEGAAAQVAEGIGTAVYVSLDGVFAGHILVADTIRPDAKASLAALRACGVKRMVMLTGDDPRVGQAVADQLGLDDCHAGLLPGDKVKQVETLLTGRQADTKSGGRARRRGKLVFVGDGINDAPVLARADVGIAMGGIASDAAMEAADVVLMNDAEGNSLESLPRAIRHARRTLRIVRQNIVLALSLKAAVLLLGALGLVGLWAAVFADVGVSVLAILNSLRAMKPEKSRQA